jgi:glycosyltransferase involved in cell wall biosynthesis
LTVLMISHDLVGPTMAGPGMRYWELSRVLAQQFPVTLAAPEGSRVPDPEQGVSLCVYRRHDDSTVRPLVDAAQIVVAPGDTLLEFPFLLTCNRYMVVDGYDPHTLESLAWNEHEALEVRVERQSQRLHVMNLQCAAGDFYIWLGWLEAMGRVNPFTYDEDHTLRRLIDVVPTGVPVERPERTRALARGTIPGIGAQDPLLVWGGGVWNWLDPLTLIRAVDRVARTIPHVRLYFPGPRHPYREFVPDMEMHQTAVRLSEELGLTGQNVFWGEWVPYSERQNYLLEADIGCSLHFETLETCFAFRTRVLDYVWAGLPMIVTGGDAASDMVREYGLGVVVDYEDVDGVSEAILNLLSMPREGFRERFERARQQQGWAHNASPLIRFCQDPRRAPDRGTAGGRPATEPASAWAVHQEQEIAHLKEVIRGYERGRFIRFTRWLAQTRRRLGGRR